MVHITQFDVVGPDGKVVKCALCNVCPNRVPILDSWGTLKKHCSVTTNTDGTFSMDPNGTHARNVEQDEAAPQSQESSMHLNLRNLFSIVKMHMFINSYCYIITVVLCIMFIYRSLLSNSPAHLWCCCVWVRMLINAVYMYISCWTRCSDDAWGLWRSKKCTTRYHDCERHLKWGFGRTEHGAIQLSLPRPFQRLTDELLLRSWQLCGSFELITTRACIGAERAGGLLRNPWRQCTTKK